MTREKALEVNRILYALESYESLKEELLNMSCLQETAYELHDEALVEEIAAVVAARIDNYKKQLEAL